MRSWGPRRYSMHHEDAIRLRHIIEAAETAQEFITGRRRDDLDSDRMLLFALVRAIEIMGEAASRVSAESRSLASAVPWGDIIGMRNRLMQRLISAKLNSVF